MLLQALLQLASAAAPALKLVVPTCADHVAGLGLSCNSSCTCPSKTGCVPVSTFAPGAAKCMPTYDDVKVVHVINSCHLVRQPRGLWRPTDELVVATNCSVPLRAAGHWLRQQLSR
eukprot:SAG31_NODE_20132_length_583_cov_0.696281_1_plen_115_part_10